MSKVIADRTIRIPTLVLDTATGRDPERLKAFFHLVKMSTPVAGVRDRKGVPVRLAAGQLIASWAELGEVWGITRFNARRWLEGFERDGLITQVDASDAPEIKVDGVEKTARGTLISVQGLRDDPFLATDEKKENAQQQGGPNRA